MKIYFIPFSKNAKDIYDRPRPSSTFIPNWYKKMPHFIDNEKSPGISKNKATSANTTMKHCSPMLDALSTGYIWSLPADMEIKFNEENNTYNFRWMVDAELVTDHSEIQHPGLPAAYNGEDFVMKWSFEYIIKTPPGYSTIFTHPINRHDLPFRTFSGIVETDTYELPVQFPFQLITNNISDRIIIEKGTPVCQFFPFKRDNWKSEIKNISENEKTKKIFDFKSTIVKSYKKKHWKKKVFN